MDSDAPQFSGKILGWLPGVRKEYKGRPIMEHIGGEGYSTHLNAVTNIDGKEYIIPTMFGGKLMPIDQAVGRVRKEKMIDPDTGHPLQGFNTVDEALIEERRQHELLAEQTKNAILRQQVQDLFK